MSFALFLKNNLSSIPPWIGYLINRLPFNYRPGISYIYTKRIKELTQFNSLSEPAKQLFILYRMKEIVNFAYQNIPAYAKYYNSEGFHPNVIKGFDDIAKIPLTSKSILDKYTLEERSYLQKGRYLVNTGGSSGTPFSFYIEPNSMGHEWAHMHTIWSKFGYKAHDFKLGFGGRSNVKDFVDYDPVRNTFALDLYADYRDVAIKLKQILRRYKVKYLHGYPSSIYDFAVYCKDHDQELQEMLCENLNGAFLGSEFPHTHYREVIEDVFGIDTISWYGHTERCVLAYEKTHKYHYEPFQTYGYAEVINVSGRHELVATSYYNQASPLIRYSTNDEVKNPVYQGGILKSFQMNGGRSGEFVIDRQGKRINLTGLIFGRHHELFNHAKYIQVKQLSIGKIEIHYVADNLSIDKAASLFDSRNIDLEISFVSESEPTRTIAGKVNLLIK